VVTVREESRVSSGENFNSVVRARLFIGLLALSRAQQQDELNYVSNLKLHTVLVRNRRRFHDEYEMGKTPRCFGFPTAERGKERSVLGSLGAAR
jgi:hypothetical protein